MDKLFENILDSDEKVIKVLRPNKLKFFFASFFGTFVVMAFFVTFGILLGTVKDEFGDVAPIGLTISVIAFGVLFAAFSVLFTILAYKNRYYAYTNKRVIIRGGIIGVDYKSLDMDMIGAIDVTVTVIDKILRSNTGSISFGSVASPMTAAGGSIFTFLSIENPYDFYKEIKLVINEKKAHKK